MNNNLLKDITEYLDDLKMFYFNASNVNADRANFVIDNWYWTARTEAEKPSPISPAQFREKHKLRLKLVRP